MRVFLFEYIRGGAMLGSAPAPSLACEDDQMLRAPTADRRERPGVEILITRDARLAPVSLPVACRSIEGASGSPEVWGRSLAAVDPVWPIAPDQSGALERISGGVGFLGIRLLPDRGALPCHWGCLPDGPASVTQPDVIGLDASLCILALDCAAALLSVIRQRVAVMDDALVLLGCVVGGLGVRRVPISAWRAT